MIQYRTKGQVVDLSEVEGKYSAEDRELDELIQSIGEIVMQQEEGLSIVDPKRVREFVACESALRKLLRGSGAKLEVVPHDGCSSVGVIRVLADGFTIKEPKKFVEATNLASNYEIYPRTDGKLMFALTFYGMTNKIKE